MEPKHIVELALQVDRLEALPRLGWAMRGVARPESVAAHVFGTAFWAMLLAELFPQADALKILRMALLHELGETKLGDIPKIAEAYLPANAKDAAERAVAVELLACRDAAGERQLALFDEFQQGETLEARLVRAADKLQMMAKALRYELDGQRGVRGFWRYAPNFPDYGMPEIRALFDELRSRRPQPVDDADAEP
jgi:putative hydrolase of HD superfamily